MLYACLAAGAVICAIQAIRVKRLLASALWLAGVSALVSLTFYMLGAQQVAVIELSVGAGLVTVLLVFAISVAGDEVMHGRSLLPRPLAWGLVILSVLLLGFLTLPVVGIGAPVSEPPFAFVLWQLRGLDVLVQVMLIFAGILGVLGLLSEPKAPREPLFAEATPAEGASPEHDREVPMLQPTPEEVPT